MRLRMRPDSFFFCHVSWGDGLSTGVDSRASLTLNRGQRLGVPSVNVAEGSAFAAQARCQLPGLPSRRLPRIRDFCAARICRR